MLAQSRTPCVCVPKQHHGELQVGGAMIDGEACEQNMILYA